jgi:hypothetical protein
MIQKIFSITLILTITFLLSITTIQAKIFQENGTYYVEQEIEKEWNLIAGLSFSNFHESSEITTDHILSAYYFDSKTQKNIEIKPVYSAGDIDSLTLYKNPFWIHSIQKGKIVYQVSPSFISKNNLAEGYKFYKGKNLIAINNEIYGKSLNEIKGNCQITNASIWNAKTQASEAININAKITFDSQDNLTGKGISLEITNDCGFMALVTPPGGSSSGGGGSSSSNSSGGSSSSSSSSNNSEENPLGDSNPPSPTQNDEDNKPLTKTKRQKILFYFFIFLLINIILIITTILIYLRIRRNEDKLNYIASNNFNSKISQNI